MARVLLLPVEFILPFVLLAGIVLFLNARSREFRQAGRVITGFAFILLALGMLRAAIAPLGEVAFAGQIAAYLQQDLLSAALIGALTAWAIHSSLAAVLVVAAFASAGVVPTPVAFALIIGANIGAGLIPLLLLQRAPATAQQIALANLFARCASALAFLGILKTGLIDAALFGREPGEQAILLHIAINATALIVFVPFVGPLISMVERLFPGRPAKTGASLNALDPAALAHPRSALACAQRELLRMAESVHAMLADYGQLLSGWDDDAAKRIAQREDAVDRMHYETKLYVSRLREERMSDEETQRAVELLSLANHIEDAGDRVSENLVGLVKRVHSDGLSFSQSGLADLLQFHDFVLTNAQLALDVLTTGDVDAARELVAGKDAIRAEERALQERHLSSLRSGDANAVQTTNQHQEVLRQLKLINTDFTHAAYPIVERAGELLDSRLVRPDAAGEPA